MQLRTLTTAILLTVIELIFAGSSLAEIDLNAELKNSLCAQDWEKAIEILDLMKAAAPESAEEITLYRSRIYGFIDSGVVVLNWPSDCTIDDTPASNQGASGNQK
ncbi:MAG: hypothetical protein F6K36_21570 [Symploca sp. SIO3C6]|uniref:Uncharacterized protein n=1 Tax=Symploca sp. SIO1C4 TaxID=2607765 RepID=A0A6B3NFE0_9CYAN|nr:hypothetical protein [Symploca sp. SIO3C6]NER30343.1 hypothetical protein [Symploca sp. SIO1C4]NET05328.1 hypothetical protein [Symploca sp. SIO2B6]